MLSLFTRLLFGCRHQRISWPQTEGRRFKQRTYVCCLDCGKELLYDWAGLEMIPRQPKVVEMNQRRREVAAMKRMRWR